MTGRGRGRATHAGSGSLRHTARPSWDTVGGTTHSRARLFCASQSATPCLESRRNSCAECRALRCRQRTALPADTLPGPRLHTHTRRASPPDSDLRTGPLCQAPCGYAAVSVPAHTYSPPVVRTPTRRFQLQRHHIMLPLLEESKASCHLAPLQR